MTPGAVFHISITRSRIDVGVDLPNSFSDLTPEQAAILEVNLHNAFEMVLSKHMGSADESN
jgi:hypothetical protein